MRSASRSIDIEVPVRTVMGVICDFESYPNVFSAVLSTDLETRDEGFWRVEFEILVLRRRVRYRLELYSEGETRLCWRLVDGEWMLENEGEWELIALGEHRTRAVYRVRVELDESIPPSFIRLLLDAALPRMLRELKRYAESRPSW